jgi:hypothetical protein
MAPVVGYCLAGSVFNVFWCIEIGFSKAEIYYVDALASELTAQFGHFQCFRLTETL